MNLRTATLCAILFAAPGAQAFAAFNCGDEHFGTNDGCDCGCGAIDPDCAHNDLASCTYDACGGDAVPAGADPTRCVENQCGDGYVGGDEVCDDGDDSDEGGCRAGCAVVNLGFLCGPRGEGCRRERCGDGQRTATERCDDGNTRAGDGCDPQCVDEVGFVCSDGQPCRQTLCGDFFIERDFTNFSGESCDDGNTVGGDGCDPRCETEPGFYCDVFGDPCIQSDCGDSVIQGDPFYRLGEGCDDGNDDVGDGCDQCQPEPGFLCVNGPCHRLECGDGVVDFDGVAALEQCDDGNDDDDDGCGSTCLAEPGFDCFTDGPDEPCRRIECGNGLVECDQLGLCEACDDGDVDSGDGCDASCEFEGGFDCVSAPGQPCVEVVCGDGVIGFDQLVGGEGCDDGNALGGDGCDATCFVEFGFVCDVAGEPCRLPVCGDARVDRQLGERCDDGNIRDGDGCSNICAPEAGFECTQAGCVALPAGWVCSLAFYGVGDGCDCGCGALDPDCTSGLASSCEFNHCFNEPAVAIDPCDASQCLGEDQAAQARCPANDDDDDDDPPAPGPAVGTCAAAPMQVPVMIGLLALLVRRRSRGAERR